MTEMSALDLQMRIMNLPRVPLVCQITPLHDLPRITRRLGGPRVLIKRDDLTGLAMTGNKARALEFLLGDALAQGADTIISSGAAQSNMLRTMCAATQSLGLEIHLVLRGSGCEPLQGNLLLDHLFGAKITFIKTSDPYSQLSRDVMTRIATELREHGRKPYIIDVRAESEALATIGYVHGACELALQLSERSITKALVVCAVSSGATLAGLTVASMALGCPFRLLGVSAQSTARVTVPNTLRKISEASALLGLPQMQPEGQFTIDDGWIGPGYSSLTSESVDALRTVARCEGVVLDPVYTSKAFAALIDCATNGSLTSDDTVVFLHTGGSPAIFAFADELGPLLVAEAGVPTVVGN